MFTALFGRFRARRVLSPPAPTTASQKAFVEEIWSTWRYEKPASQSANVIPQRPEHAAERVSKLKRLGEYDKALQITLSEVEREERDGVRSGGGRAMVHWYYWEAAAIYRKLKRYDEEVALVRRFARNHDIHFRTFSKRNRSTLRGNEAWAARFLERLETAKALAIGQR
jgi:hypothetical protein